MNHDDIEERAFLGTFSTFQNMYYNSGNGERRKEILNEPWRRKYNKKFNKIKV